METRILTLMGMWIGRITGLDFLRFGRLKFEFF